MQLIHTPISSDLRQAGMELVEGIESGEITGLGIVAVIKGGRFFVDAFGSVARNPHASQGFAMELVHCLHEIGKQKRAANTTI